MNCSPPGSSVCGIFQVRILEWVAISFSRGSFLTQGLNLCLLHWQADSLPLNHLESPFYIVKVKVKSLSRVRLLATPWTAAYEAPPSMGFSRQEYWSGVPLPSPKGKLGEWKAYPSFAALQLYDLGQVSLHL